MKVKVGKCYRYWPGRDDRRAPTAAERAGLLVPGDVVKITQCPQGSRRFVYVRCARTNATAYVSTDRMERV